MASYYYLDAQTSFQMLKLASPHQDLSFDILHLYICDEMMTSRFQPGGASVIFKRGPISQIAQSSEIFSKAHRF